MKNWQKQILKNRARKFERLRRKSKKKIIAKRKSLLGISKNERIEMNKRLQEKRDFIRQYTSYKHVHAPTVLSMTENVEESVRFISTLEKLLSAKKKVFVEMSHVKKIASGAIIVLLSIMIKFKEENIPFNGSKPFNRDARKMLDNSGFFDHLYEENGDQITLKGQYDIFTHANKTVDSELSEKLISNVSQQIWGAPYRCPGVQRVYLELMQNTNNHASLNRQKVHHWYTTVKYNPQKNKAYFSFIDYGVGIIESINKNEKGKFWSSLKRIFSTLKPKDSGDFLRLLLDGSIHKTATQHYYRGKGLPGIYKAFTENKISNLIVITNDAYADCRNNNYVTLSDKFEGTYVYWELESTNHKVEAI